MGILDHLTCLLRNLYTGQKATIWNHRLVPNWERSTLSIQYVHVCVLSPCLFNFYAEHIMWNAGLKEAEAGIKIAGRNISNLRYADDTSLMAESEEELKSLLMKLKEESEKAVLKLYFQKCKIRASSSTTSWEIDGEKMEIVTKFIFLGSKTTADGDCSHEIKRCLLFGRNAMNNLDSILKAETLLCQQRSI